MTDADLAALRTWAEAHAPAGSPQAAQVLSLLAERDACASALAQAEATHAEYARHLAAVRERLAPVVRFVEWLEMAKKVSGPDSCPDTAVVGFATVPGNGLTLGHLRALAALLEPPTPAPQPESP